MDNNIYNLMLQITQDQKSIWRMKKYYINDAGSCQECKDFWSRFITQKEENVRIMQDLVKKHLK